MIIFEGSNQSILEDYIPTIFYLLFKTFIYTWISLLTCLFLSLTCVYCFILLFFVFFYNKKVEIVFKWVDVCLIDICCMLDSHSFIFTMIWIKFVVILVFVTHWFTLLFYWLVHASHRYVWIIHSWMRFLSSYAC